MSDKMQDEFKSWIQNRQLQIVQNCASEEFFMEEVEIRITRLIDELSILQCKLESLKGLIGADSFAISFQSIAQYRAALLESMK